jgi:4-aminobutyrate aminotransferase
MGRTGKWFAIEHWDGVVPDITALAKGIASGLPLGATVASRDLMTWPPGSHGTTFGGNPVSCVAALATIEQVEKSLMANARRVGAFMARELNSMAERHDLIGWVNALGLMIGIEIVAKPGTNLPAPELRNRIEIECYKRGVLLLGCGPSAIRLAPPLVLTRAQAQVALEVLDEALTVVGRAGARARARARARRK